MGRDPRCFDPDGIYHLTAHGVDDRPIFIDDVDRQGFVIRLKRVALRERWHLFAVCLMDTHHHLILRPTVGTVGDGMRDLNGGHSRVFNRRHGRRGALFEARYRHRDIVDDEHLGRAVTYVEGNPVAAGMVAVPEAWPWSTYEGALLRTLLEPCLAPELRG